jgi:hypothetical protein
MQTPATTSLAPEAGVVSEVQLKPGGPLRGCPTPGFRWFVNFVTQVRTEEHETFRALSVYLLPEMLPPGTPARMRHGAPLITIVQSDAAAAAAWECAICAGRAWTVATAKTSAVEQASASVLMDVVRFGVVRFIGESLSVSVGGYWADCSSFDQSWRASLSAGAPDCTRPIISRQSVGARRMSGRSSAL